MIHFDVEVDEDGLQEADKFKGDLQRDRNKIVVENDECQKVVREVL